MSLAIVNPNGPKCGGGRISHRRPQVENLKKLQFKIVKFWGVFFNFWFFSLGGFIGIYRVGG